MKPDVNSTYLLKHDVKLFQGLFNGVIIPEGTLVKVLYSDDAVTHCEAINGPCDGLTLVTSADDLTHV